MCVEVYKFCVQTLFEDDVVVYKTDLSLTISTDE